MSPIDDVAIDTSAIGRASAPAVVRVSASLPLLSLPVSASIVRLKSKAPARPSGG